MHPTEITAAVAGEQRRDRTRAARLARRRPPRRLARAILGLPSLRARP